MGCLYGQAIGDALGLGTEFMSKSEVKRFYPDKLIRYEQIVQDSHRRRWNIGSWTDDTEMMLCLLRAFDKNGFDCIVAAKNFKSWFNGCPLGIGRHTIKVLMCGDYTDAPFEASKIIWDASQGKSAANGAIMRTSVMGLWNSYNDEWVTRACMLTHYDPRCVISCKIASVIIHFLVWKNRQFSEKEIIGMATTDELKEYINLAYLSEDISALSLSEQSCMGYTYRTLAAALWCYWHSSSFEEGLLAIVNEGGDADTNAALACAILGAKFGYKLIPQYYIDNLYNEKAYRGECETFVDLAMLK